MRRFPTAGYIAEKHNAGRPCKPQCAAYRGSNGNKCLPYAIDLPYAYAGRKPMLRGSCDGIEI